MRATGSLADAVRLQLTRQVVQWNAAVVTMNDPRDFAPSEAWRAVERDLGIPLRAYLQDAVDGLRRDADRLRSALGEAGSLAALDVVHSELVEFRHRVFQATTVLDLYGDAIVERVGSGHRDLLRGLDTLAERSAAAALEPLGRPVPPFMAYLDRGMGDALNEAGLRVYAGGPPSPAAVLSVARDSLHLPSAVFHEAGHQVSSLCGWEPELSRAIADALSRERPSLRTTWAGWALEIGPDAYGFVCGGYASIVGLHDTYVIVGPDTIFSVVPGDPHPTPYLRILLGVEMCRRSFGEGPWDQLAEAWRHAYPPDRMPPGGNREFVLESIRALPTIAAAILDVPMAAFAGQALSALVDPRRVGPAALTDLERGWGTQLLASSSPLWSDPVRLFALTGYRMATRPELAAKLALDHVGLLTRLGALRRAASASGQGRRTVATAGSPIRR